MGHTRFEQTRPLPLPRYTFDVSKQANLVPRLFATNFGQPASLLDTARTESVATLQDQFCFQLHQNLTAAQEFYATVPQQRLHNLVELLAQRRDIADHDLIRFADNFVQVVGYRAATVLARQAQAVDSIQFLQRVRDARNQVAAMGINFESDSRFARHRRFLTHLETLLTQADQVQPEIAAQSAELLARGLNANIPMHEYVVIAENLARIAGQTPIEQNFLGATTGLVTLRLEEFANRNNGNQTTQTITDFERITAAFATLWRNQVAVQNRDIRNHIYVQVGELTRCAIQACNRNLERLTATENHLTPAEQKLLTQRRARRVWQTARPLLSEDGNGLGAMANIRTWDQSVVEQLGRVTSWAYAATKAAGFTARNRSLETSLENLAAYFQARRIQVRADMHPTGAQEVQIARTTIGLLQSEISLRNNIALGQLDNRQTELHQAIATLSELATTYAQNIQTLQGVEQPQMLNDHRVDLLQVQTTLGFLHIAQAFQNGQQVNSNTNPEIQNTRAQITALYQQLRAIDPPIVPPRLDDEVMLFLALDEAERSATTAELAAQSAVVVAETRRAQIFEEMVIPILDRGVGSFRLNEAVAILGRSFLETERDLAELRKRERSSGDRGPTTIDTDHLVELPPRQFCYRVADYVITQDRQRLEAIQQTATGWRANLVKQAIDLLPAPVVATIDLPGRPKPPPDGDGHHHEAPPRTDTILATAETPVFIQHDQLTGGHIVHCRTSSGHSARVEINAIRGRLTIRDPLDIIAGEIKRQTGSASVQAIAQEVVDFAFAIAAAIPNADSRGLSSALKQLQDQVLSTRTGHAEWTADMVVALVQIPGMAKRILAGDEYKQNNITVGRFNSQGIIEQTIEKITQQIRGGGGSRGTNYNPYTMNDIIGYLLDQVFERQPARV